MAVTVADIIQGVEDQYSTAVAEAKLKRLIEAAVRFYSRWNPYILSMSFSTVVDQQAYDLPAACITVRDVLWLPSGDVLISGAERLAIHQKQILETFNQWALRYVDAIEEMEYHDAIKGNWEIRNAQVLLWPIPTSASHTVTVQYASRHDLSEDTTQYATIPPVDVDILVDLALAEVLQGGRIDASLEPDWAEGLTRISHRHIGRDLDVLVATLRNSVKNKYGRPSGVVA